MENKDTAVAQQMNLLQGRKRGGGVKRDGSGSVGGKQVIARTSIAFTKNDYQIANHRNSSDGVGATGARVVEMSPKQNAPFKARQQRSTGSKPTAMIGGMSPFVQNGGKL